jgi:hypothetical protein
VPEAPTRAPRARRLARGLLLGLLFALGLARVDASSRVASADEAEDVRAALLRGPPDTWAATFQRVESNPALVGRALGPLFRDRADAARAVSAWTAAALADRAKKGELPLLSDDIVRRAARDEAWLRDVHARCLPERDGWAAIVRAASLRARIASGDPEDRLAAVFVLRHDPTPRSALDLADLWAEGPADVAAAARDALAWSLGRPFESADAARRFFAEHAGESYVEWLRALSHAKDRPDSPVFARMLAEAKANLERATTLEELAPYLSPAATPYVELRRLAAARAARVDAAPEAWLVTLVDVLRDEKDRETLSGLVAVARKIRVSGGERGKDLARAVLDRLPEAGGSGDLTLGLIDLLTGVADPPAVAKAFSVLESTADGAVLEALLGLAGAVGGNESILVGFHAGLATRTDATSVRLRARALDALAEGVRARRDGPAAGEYLRSVLRGHDADPADAARPRETSGPGRQAAVRALEAFPGRPTAERLAEVARLEGADPGLARLAALVLGKLSAAGDADAAEALVALAGDASLEAARTEAVRSIAKLPAEATDAARVRAKEAVRAALDPGGAAELRAAAVEAAGALADEGAWDGAVAFAAESFASGGAAALPGLRPALERLARTLAQDAAADGRLAAGFRRLAEAGALDAALGLAGEAAEAGAGRPALQVARADLLRARAEQPSRDPAERRRDFRDADQIVRTVVRATPPSEQTGPAWALVLRVRADVLDRLLDDPSTDPAERKAALLAAIETAALRHDPDAAKEGLALLETARARDDLTTEEKAALDRQAESLRQASKATPQ